jgi:hypothetical protein
MVESRTNQRNHWVFERHFGPSASETPPYPRSPTGKHEIGRTKRRLGRVLRNRRTEIDRFRLVNGTAAKPGSHLVALWSAAFSVFHVNRLAGSKQRPQLRSRLSNGLARATSLMVMLTNDSASRYVEKTSCGLRRLRDAFGFQQLDSTRNHARTDPRNAQMG